jgi:hypothetical protein
MARNTVYPFGIGGQLPSGITIVNDLTTGGADKALSAEQGKIIGEELYGSNRELVDMTALTQYGVYVANATNKWTTGDTAGVVFIPVTPGDRYQLFASDTKSTAYFVAQNDSHTNNTTPSYATGYNSGVEIPAGESTDVITIPSDGHYIALWTKLGGTATMASAYKITAETATEGLVERTSRLEDQMVDVSEEVFGKGRNEVNLSNKTKYHIYVSSVTGLWETSDAVDMVFFPVTAGEVYEISAPVSIVPYALLQSDSHITGEAPDYCSGYENTYTVNVGESSGNITIPNDGNYLAIWTKLSSGNTAPELYLITETPINGLDDRVESLEDYVENIHFYPAGVDDNLIDYVKSIQTKTKVLTLREQEIIPSSGAHLTSYGGKLYFTVDGVKYEVTMTPAPYYYDDNE